MLPPRTKQNRLEEIVGAILGGQQQIVSYAGASQYQDAEGIRTGASSCGLAALNCARVLFRTYEDTKVVSNFSPAGHTHRLLNGVLCQQTTEVSPRILMSSHASYASPTPQEITSICSSWPSDKHLEVDELLKLPIFKQSFENANVQYALTDYANLLSVLR